MSKMKKIIRSDEKTFLGLKANPAVFFSSAFIIFALVACTFILGAEKMESVFSSFQAFISQTAGWFFIFIIHFVLGFCIWLMFSKYGSIRL